MTIGDTVRILRGFRARREGYNEWAQNNLPGCGRVTYISPHGWALVRVFRRGTEIEIYGECFDTHCLRVVSSKAKRPALMRRVSFWQSDGLGG